MTKLSVVSTLYESNMRDIPAMLRRLADSIEAEEEADDSAKAVAVVRLTEDERIAIYGMGDADRFKTMGLLQAGATKLADTVEEI